MKKAISYIQNIIHMAKYLSQHSQETNLRGKIHLQLITALSFLILSITNIAEHSYTMLLFTALGFVINTFFALLAYLLKSEKLCSYSSIIVCTLAFALFVIVGGNDGFAALWIILMPVFAMSIMDFFAGLLSSVAIQIFLIVLLRTPLRAHLLYPYNEQFCLRFPLLFLVSFLMGLATTIILLSNKYKAQVRLAELQKVTEIANRLAKQDSLTALANRRCAYEMFEQEFTDDSLPHCVVMGDIDHFKQINDTYGHRFGDEVLTVVSRMIREELPTSYLKSRWGGEEFLIAANEPLAHVYEQIEALRKKIAAHPFLCNGETLSVTLTFGIATYHHASELHEAIHLADSRMYKGKENAHNSTVCQ